MPHHDRSDDSFDWKSLYEAETLANNIMKYGARIGVHSKEKYGTLRWNLYLFDGSLHNVTHPGYVYSQYPKWLWNFDCTYRPLSFLKFIVIPYQKLVVKLTFSILAKKYPHIIDEIISDAPRELLSKKLSKQAGKLWKRSCNICKKLYTCDNDSCPYCL